MSPPRSLVLGGTAFIGRHLVEHLQAQGHDVTLLNRGGSTPPPGVAVLVADRHDPRGVRAALAGRDWDHVFDISASVQVAPLESVGALVEDLDGHCGVYVFVSSIAACRMGQGAFPWTEDVLTTRSRPGKYGGHKAAVERLLAERRAARGFPYVVVRPAAVYGPHDNIPDGEMAMFLRLRQGRPVLLPHDGLVCFPYGHVADLARALLLAARTPAAQGEIFNVTGESVTARHYVDTLARIVGVEPDIVAIPEDVLATLTPPLPFNHRFQKLLHAVMSIDKARRVLGFEPAFDFEQGHRQTYAWFLEQGFDRLAQPLNDPVWNVSWDFAHEAAVAAAIRARAGV
ncbi:MAG: NAD-dependent epimerase/dehydratase family protein [Gammaproteobacteria bacterium]|nr:NAD-dependent epimerase/dehydratase family protein [Gammaproteobacteria bacterium]